MSLTRKIEAARQALLALDTIRPGRETRRDLKNIARARKALRRLSEVQ